ncbi:MAG: signal peptidase I [Planctomycetota bacterium]|nr:signal peptidase I [Planctomycetota bacterium]
MAEDGPGELDGRLSAEQVRKERKEQEGRAGKEGESKEEHDGGAAALKEWIGLLVRAGFWALCIYLFVFQVSVVKGDSMQPNYQPGDRLLIDKLTFMMRDPRPGDVVVFEAVMEDGGRWVHRDYIKRVVAGPDDKVEIYDGAVFVNGSKVEGEWLVEEFRSSDREAQSKGPFTPVFRVPPGRYFVLGDRRWNSRDSRYSEIGYVPKRRIKGKVRWRFWPAERWAWF